MSIEKVFFWLLVFALIVLAFLIFLGWRTRVHDVNPFFRYGGRGNFRHDWFNRRSGYKIMA